MPADCQGGHGAVTLVVDIAIQRFAVFTVLEWRNSVCSE
jgi:hypothetical protein